MTLLAVPAALAPLRMILGLTHNELAFAIRLQIPESRVSGGRLKKFERTPSPCGRQPHESNLSGPSPMLLWR